MRRWIKCSQVWLSSTFQPCAFHRCWRRSELSVHRQTASMLLLPSMDPTNEVDQKRFWFIKSHLNNLLLFRNLANILIRWDKRSVYLYISKKRSEQYSFQIAKKYSKQTNKQKCFFLPNLNLQYQYWQYQWLFVHYNLSMNHFAHPINYKYTFLLG